MAEEAEQGNLALAKAGKLMGQGTRLANGNRYKVLIVFNINATFIFTVETYLREFSITKNVSRVFGPDRAFWHRPTLV